MMQVDLFFVLLTLQQLQAGAASCAHMADLVFCVPLGAAGGSVAPTWTQMNIQDFKFKYVTFSAFIKQQTSICSIKILQSHKVTPPLFELYSCFCSFPFSKGPGEKLWPEMFLKTFEVRSRLCSNRIWIHT